MPQIYEALDNNQVDYQSSVVKMESIIANRIVSILIEPGSNLSYMAPHTIDKCKLQRVIHVNPWLVQIATGTKRKIAEVIPACQFIMDGLPTQETLNILPLISYEGEITEVGNTFVTI
jgi:hypothetical protein